jgi:hypothetical protein
MLAGSFPVQTFSGPLNLPKKGNLRTLSNLQNARVSARTVMRLGIETPGEKGHNFEADE